MNSLSSLAYLLHAVGSTKELATILKFIGSLWGLWWFFLCFKSVVRFECSWRSFWVSQTTINSFGYLPATEDGLHLVHLGFLALQVTNLSSISDELHHEEVGLTETKDGVGIRLLCNGMVTCWHEQAADMFSRLGLDTVLRRSLTFFWVNIHFKVVFIHKIVGNDFLSNASDFSAILPSYIVLLPCNVFTSPLNVLQFICIGDTVSSKILGVFFCGRLYTHNKYLFFSNYRDALKLCPTTK